MKSIIKRVLDLFNNFESQFYLFDKIERKLIINDPIILENQLGNEINILKRQFRGVYLMGEITVLKNIKKELKKIEITVLEVINLNIGLSFDNFIIEPEELLTILKIKLKYIEILIDYLDSYISPNKMKTFDPQLSFEDLFENDEIAEVCLSVLKILERPVLTNDNYYIGDNKGIFSLWIDILQKHKPKSLIKALKPIQYKEILNEKICGLNLSEDGSEFRKVYRRLETNKIDIQIKTILSQFSQDGKLGKLG